MTHRYIGTKEVLAWPAEKDGKPGYGVKYADGYTSWSPKEQFEEAYRTSDPGMDQDLTFGDALFYLKQKRRVTRRGWNGAGMWLTIMDFASITDDGSGNLDGLALLPWIGMKTAHNCFVPWLCSQTDALAEDWIVID